MKVKIRTVATLFFGFFGGTFLLKFLTYKFILKTEINVEESIYEHAIIAFFVALLLTFVNGMRVNWKNEKKQ